MNSYNGTGDRPFCPLCGISPRPDVRRWPLSRRQRRSEGKTNGCEIRPEVGIGFAPQNQCPALLRDKRGSGPDRLPGFRIVRALSACFGMKRSGRGAGAAWVVARESAWASQVRWSIVPATNAGHSIGAHPAHNPSHPPPLASAARRRLTPRRPAPGPTHGIALGRPWPSGL